MEVKGTVLQTMRLFIPKRHSRSEYELWLSKLSPEVRLIYKMGPTKTNWYPVNEYLVEPTRIYCSLFHGGDRRGAREAGRFSAEHSLRDAYNLFVNPHSVDFIISRVAKIMPMYYRPSAAEVVESTDGLVRVRITDPIRIDEIIEHRIAGWLERALELHNCNGVSVDIHLSATKGDPYTEFLLSWSTENEEGRECG